MASIRYDISNRVLAAHARGLRFMKHIVYAAYDQIPQDADHCYHVDCITMRTLAEFYAELVQVLPLEQPISSRVHWDAFNDAAGAGFAFLAGSTIQVLVHHWQPFAAADSKGFTTSQEVLSWIADELQQHHQKTLTISYVS